MELLALNKKIAIMDTHRLVFIAQNVILIVKHAMDLLLLALAVFLGYIFMMELVLILVLNFILFNMDLSVKFAQVNAQLVQVLMISVLVVLLEKFCRERLAQTPV